MSIIKSRQRVRRNSHIDYLFEHERQFIPDSAIFNPLTTALKRLETGEAGLSYEDFTDGGGASGTIDVGFDIPAGAIFIGWAFRVREAFASAGGETAVTLLLGDGTDADRYNPSSDPTISLAAQQVGVWRYVVPALIGTGAGDGVMFHATAATTPTLTLTLSGGTPDWTGVDAGVIDVMAMYLDFGAVLWPEEAAA